MLSRREQQKERDKKDAEEFKANQVLLERFGIEKNASLKRSLPEQRAMLRSYTMEQAEEERSQQMQERDMRMAELLAAQGERQQRQITAQDLQAFGGQAARAMQPPSMEMLQQFYDTSIEEMPEAMRPRQMLPPEAVRQALSQFPGAAASPNFREVTQALTAMQPVDGSAANALPQATDVGGRKIIFSPKTGAWEFADQAREFSTSFTPATDPDGNPLPGTFINPNSGQAVQMNPEIVRDLENTKHTGRKYAGGLAQLEGMLQRGVKKVKLQEVGGNLTITEAGWAGIPIEDAINNIKAKTRPAAPAVQTSGGQGTAIPQGAIDRLKANPKLVEDFDAAFGPGAARRVLGK